MRLTGVHPPASFEKSSKYTQTVSPRTPAARLNCSSFTDDVSTMYVDCLWIFREELLAAEIVAAKMSAIARAIQTISERDAYRAGEM